MTDIPPKTCACTGVRWCAKCRDPRVRSAHRMDDVVPLPPALSSRPEAARSSPAERSKRPSGPGHENLEIYEFDLERQSAPGCPSFQGVHVYRDFLSSEEEARLLDEIEAVPFKPAQSGKLKQHFGPRMNFNKRKMNADGFRGLPGYAQWIETRLRTLAARDDPNRQESRDALRAALASYETTDAFVLRYREADSSNLDFHRDDVFAYGEVILDLSLQAESVLTFLHEENCVRVPLPARSLAVLHGPARFVWEHAVLAYDIRGIRTSITLRTLGEELRRTDAGRRVLERARTIDVFDV